MGLHIWHLLVLLALPLLTHAPSMKHHPASRLGSQAPVVGLHVALWQSLGGSQTTGVLLQLPLPTSHKSVVQASKSLQSLLLLQHPGTLTI